MDWVAARRRFLSLALHREEGDPSASPDVADVVFPGRGPLLGPHKIEPADGAERLIASRPVSLCIGSGKGGTGKSVVSASLAQLLSTRGRTLILDADLGVGNAHILQDVSPDATLVDVVEGRSSVGDVRVPCSENVDLVAAGSGVPRMADLSSYELHLMAHGIEAIEVEYRYLMVDSGAGISRQTMTFAEASDVVLVVTTPDLTAMTDAYAFLKVLYGRNRDARALLVVNRCEDEEEAERVHGRIGDVCARFLGQAPRSIGWIPNDPAVTQAVNRRAAVVSSHPESEAAQALRVLSVRILEELGRGHPRGLGRLLMRQVGYESKRA